MVEDLADQTVLYLTMQHCFIWYNGRFTQWLVHALRLRTLQTPGQVDTFSPESSFFFIATLLTEKRTWPYMQHRVGIQWRI